MGFYGIFRGLQYQNSRFLSKALDADSYDVANSVTIKIPMSIPYMPDQLDFTRVTGKFEHNGKLFRKVKQKYAQDTLTVVCVKDIVHKKIDLAITEFVKTFAENPFESNTSSKVNVTFLKDFLPMAFKILPHAEGWVLQVIQTRPSCNLNSSFSVSIIQPPE